jgi:hypothetical protein
LRKNQGYFIWNKYSNPKPPSGLIIKEGCSVCLKAILSGTGFTRLCYFQLHVTTFAAHGGKL